MSLSWSNGDIVERSPRKRNQQQKEQQEQEQDPHFAKQQQQLAQHQSLLSEEDPWSIVDFSNMRSSMNRREDTYNKISEREMVGQMGRNPFMSENNYLNDVMTQDNFLKPVSTSFEREKGSATQE
uniref:Uncharacterized protein n=1 Tax=viral metagenome TaxID=1070528 RepID=A0A6C0HXG0_9ZZZZ